MSVSSDIVAEILKVVDGTTIANAGCSSSHFRAVAKQEWLWEEACRSLWPSTEDTNIKELISSLGGFKKFYADCFPLINVCTDSLADSMEDYEKLLNPASNHYDNHIKELHGTVSPSDFVSVVDVQYKNKAICSKILWGIPLAGDVIHSRSSSVCSFLWHLPCCDFPISGIGRREEDVELEMLANMRLSWIVINARTKQAVNLSSWRPLEARKLWGSDNDFAVCYGSIVPAGKGFPLKLGVCKIVVKCRVDRGREAMNLQIREISMQLEDMVGCEVNEREGLLILQRSVEWRRRSKDYDQVIRRCHGLLEVQSDLMEEKMRNQCGMNPLCILVFLGLAALSFYHFIL